MVAAFTGMFISNLGNCNLEINAQQIFINIQKKTRKWLYDWCLTYDQSDLIFINDEKVKVM